MKAKQDAKIAAALICKIWKHYQVGIYQVRLKHVVGYIMKDPLYFTNDANGTRKEAIYRMLTTLHKEKWIPEIENRINSERREEPSTTSKK